MSEPSLSRKSRGAFFTPREITDFLSEWALRRASDTVLEPSCGEAAFLVSATRRLRALGASPDLRRQLVGIDVHDESVRCAERELQPLGTEADLQIGDFFDLEPERRFDAVIGNPPYVRYQSFAGSARAKACEAALAQGVRLTGLASSWAAFVVHASAFLKADGRLALVLPAELLSVTYAAPVRRFLMDRFATVRLVLFEQRVFPGVLEEVVLLLAEGTGPTDHCELCQAPNLQALNAPERRTWRPADSEAKWTPALLTSEAAKLYSESVAGPAFDPLLGWGETNLGMVSGNNRYFALTASRATELRLAGQDLLRISPPGSAHLRGLTFAERAWEEMRDGGARVYLFDPPVEGPSLGALRYIKEGEARGIPAAYKCRVRSPWWKVPQVPMPDLFLTYMNHDTPRLVANRARVLYLNSVHGVVLREGRKRIGMDLLPIGSLNSVTLLGSELVGRSYGGGMLKLEPKEADRLPVPGLVTLEAVQGKLRALKPQLGRHLRNTDLDEVVKLVDRILLREHLGFREDDVELLREARSYLFARRKARARLKA